MKHLTTITIAFLFFSNLVFASQNLSAEIKSLEKKSEGIVLGKIISKAVKKKNGLYFTEYKLKVKEWLYKKNQIKNNNHITLRLLGAELKDKGIVIKASNTPGYIPIKKEAIFVLQRTNFKDIYTLAKNGVIYNQ